jgi:hypothetical protein
MNPQPLKGSQKRRSRLIWDLQVSFLYAFSQYIKLSNKIALTTTIKTLTINKIMDEMYFGLAEKLKRKIEARI